MDLVFLPLMQHTRPTVEVVSGALALAQRLPEQEQRQTLAALIGLGQRFLGQDELAALLEDLMATSIGELILERGFERGFEQGRAMTLREAILEILTTRFGVVAPPLNEQLLQIDNVERLKALVGKAAAADSLEEFVAALQER